MGDSNLEKSFHNVREISITRLKKGYSLRIDNGEAVELENAGNFEWRVADGKSPSIQHMYFGNESGDKEGFNFKISFKEHCDVRISNGDPRCYIQIT